MACVWIGVLFILSLIMRASAIVWFPLLWALKPTKKVDRSWESELRGYWAQLQPQLIAVLSAMTLALLLVKFLQAALIGESLHWVASLVNRMGLNFTPGVMNWAIAVFRPDAIPIWHIAVGLNSFLGLYFAWQVRAWLKQYDLNVGPKEADVNERIATLFFFRRLLTAYTIVWNLFIVYHVAKLLPVPETGGQFFPWV